MSPNLFVALAVVAAFVINFRYFSDSFYACQCTFVVFMFLHLPKILYLCGNPFTSKARWFGWRACVFFLFSAEGCEVGNDGYRFTQQSRPQAQRANLFGGFLLLEKIAFGPHQDFALTTTLSAHLYGAVVLVKYFLFCFHNG